MGLMSAADAAFLLPESRETPIHVGGLQVFELPGGAPDDYLQTLYQQAISVQDIDPLFCKRAQRSALTLGQWSWVRDRDVDLEHHVRHSALPGPGRVRELLALTSRLHGTPLDRTRPLWEAHLIEGLEGNRFAVYTKMHHALVDGVSALRLVGKSLSTDPADTDTRMPYAARERARRRPVVGAVDQLLGVPGAALHAATGVAGLTPALARLALRGLREQAAVLPMQAPRSILNVPITGSRRFAAQSWPLERIRTVTAATGATVNDVFVAMCAGALRDYLSEQDALPATPLVAMIPTSLRPADTGDSSSDGGNAVGTILCDLATTTADPALRLQAIRDSIQVGKDIFGGLSQLQATALSAAVMSPLLLTALPSLQRLSPPAFNIIISNVPGPRGPLYWNGARLQGNYPLSIPFHGQALNITVVSYDEQLHVGITGCRRSVPRLQRMLVHLEAALTALEQATGGGGRQARRNA